MALQQQMMMIIIIIIKVIYSPTYYKPERPGITKSIQNGNTQGILT